MVSTVNAVRSRLQNAYAPLRIQILDHYHTMAQLTGRDAGDEAHRLPRKLGQWHHTHSDKVLAACPELLDTVNAVEGLCLARDPNYIRGQHKRQKPGPRPAWQRIGPLNNPTALNQAGGEYRDKKL